MAGGAAIQTIMTTKNQQRRQLTIISINNKARVDMVTG